MAVPVSYTERSFSQYLDNVLGPTADALDWKPGQDATSAGDYAEILNDTLLAMGLDAVSDVAASQVYQFRTMARVQLWKAVAAAVAGDYTFSADGGSYSRDQVLAHAETMLAMAQADAAQFDPAYAAIQDDLIYGEDDPYADHDDYLTQYIEDL